MTPTDRKHVEDLLTVLQMCRGQLTGHGGLRRGYVLQIVKETLEEWRARGFKVKE